MHCQKTFALIVALFISACADEPTNTDLDATPRGSPGDAASPADGAPPQPDAALGRGYAEFCTEDTDCESGLCYLQLCSARCDANVANDCRAHDAFCAPIGPDTFGCFGRVETGDDVGDDAILQIDEPLTGKLSPIGDADMFQVTLPEGRYLINALPAADGDVRLEVYNDLTKNEANADSGGVGTLEEVRLTVEASPAKYYLVVRSIGETESAFTISITPQP